MTASGLLLWFNNFSLRYLPTWVSDAATAVHFYEAILATLSIMIWHFYQVIFDPDVYSMEKSWWTGRTSAAHLQRTRPAYYFELLLQAAGRQPERQQHSTPGERQPPDEGDPHAADARPAEEARQNGRM